ncbi:MAG TPA: hypothetical protein VF181_06695 [Balneolaceae bacterium]
MLNHFDAFVLKHHYANRIRNNRLAHTILPTLFRLPIPDILMIPLNGMAFEGEFRDKR